VHRPRESEKVILEKKAYQILERGPMQAQCISDQLEFEGFDGRRVVAGFDGGRVTSDAGALLLREAPTG
jgi:hypothetical protein